MCSSPVKMMFCHNCVAVTCTFGSIRNSCRKGLAWRITPIDFASLVLAVLLFASTILAEDNAQSGSKVENFENVTPWVSKTKAALDALAASRSGTDRCWSKAESKHYHRGGGQASEALLQRLQRYEEDHQRCTDPDKMKTSFAEDYAPPERPAEGDCKYVIYRGAGGLGNRLQGLLSTFLYALLTDRTLLVQHGDDSELLCEPFGPASSWYMPPELESHVLKELDMRRTNVVQLRKDKEEGRPLPNKAFLFLKWDDSREDETFFCSDYQAFVSPITWVLMHQARYLAPAFVAMEVFRGEMERLFPDRRVYTRLARYLLHPNNTYWERITAVYANDFTAAGKRVGFQLRTFAFFDEWANERILDCAWNVSGVLPAPPTPQEWARLRHLTRDERRAGEDSSGSVFVFVATMKSHHVPYLRKVYLNGMAADGSPVTFYSLSAVEGENWDLQTHGQALVEVWLLSFCDQLLTSAHSTFGSLASALAGYPPYLLNIAEHAYGKFDDPEDNWRTSKRPVCWLMDSVDPCGIPVAKRLCAVEGEQFPRNKPDYLRACQDQAPCWQIYQS